MIQTTVQKKVDAYIQEIAERLAQRHAAVMVGSGFSKNAIDSFPNWNELGTLFFEELNSGKKPNEDDHFLNPLKLASEFEALFNKNKLNNFIKTCIPDKQFSPSQLHVDLLNLPWVDVFTTNYDTLLERASKQVINRRFDIVTQEKQLPFSQSPRIIKLHGCFDNSTELIITEDDYRDYPKKYATFVNTVQQSLIENTLCLIGFSGDDPNFLNWISWILFNLGKEAAPKFI